MIARRQFLSFATIGASALWANPQMALAALETDRRFIFIIQRGGADGLDIVRPYGDPAYIRLRGELTENPNSSIKLDGLFALHPALANVGKMYASGEALFVHALASPYRGRSHFDGQDVLEAGGTQPYLGKDGWLKRLMAMLPASGGGDVVAPAPTTPIALHGPTQVSCFTSSAHPVASDDLPARAATLSGVNPKLHRLMGLGADANDNVSLKNVQDSTNLGKLAAKFLSERDGPRIAMLQTAGWDTHCAQANIMDIQLRGLDSLLTALRDGLGPTWRKTTVLVATEFGRTAAVNNTKGTDHGTASVAMVLGGAVSGGRVIADWPGLGQNQLYQQRDLRPSTPLVGVIAGLAAESFGLDPEQVATELFDNTARTSLLTGLIRH